MSIKQEPVPMETVLPSFGEWKRNGEIVKPQILVLEIKDKDGLRDDALGFVLVERHESYKHYSDGPLEAAGICLSFKRVAGKYSYGSQGKGYFLGGFTPSINTVSLTSTIAWSEGAVFLDLPGLVGQRIGTYLMNEIVQWAQQWPDATVASIKLYAGQAQPDNKERRNRFYEQFGIVFDYDDEQRRSGQSRPMLARDLETLETWKKNIVEHNMHDYLGSIVDLNERLSSDLNARDHACANLIAERKRAEARPIRWALRQLYFRHSQSVFVGLVLIVIIGASWAKATYGG